jgi:hypothetical protein
VLGSFYEGDICVVDCRFRYSVGTVRRGGFDGRRLEEAWNPCRWEIFLLAVGTVALRFRVGIRWLELGGFGVGKREKREGKRPNYSTIVPSPTSCRIYFCYLLRRIVNHTWLAASKARRISQLCEIWPGKVI